MKPQPPKSWFEDHTGLRIDLRWIARKTWKAYFYLVTSLSVFFTPTPTLTQARPPEVDPHVPSQSQHGTVTLEGSVLFNVASTSASSVNMSVSDVVDVADAGWVVVAPSVAKKKPPPPPTSSHSSTESSV